MSASLAAYMVAADEFTRSRPKKIAQIQRNKGSYYLRSRTAHTKAIHRGREKQTSNARRAVLQRWHRPGFLDNSGGPQKLGVADMLGGFAPMNSTPETFVPLQEIARRLSITTRTLYREIAAKRFPTPVKIRGTSRVLESDYAAYVAALMSKRQS
jgi:predicted DNA-binding transcriptional regulator AlpA